MTTQPVATTAEAPVPAQHFTVPDGFATSGGVTGAVLAAIAVFLSLRKRWSKDNLELTKDRAETDLIKTYQTTIVELRAANERLDQTARDAWRTRSEDAKLIGELTAKVEHLTDMNVSMKQTVLLMEQQVRELLALVRGPSIRATTIPPQPLLSEEG